MTRTDYKKCENCTSYVVAGDRGECHAGLPVVGHYQFPQVPPEGFCEAGFRLNPTKLFDRIDMLNQTAGELQDDVTELELELAAAQEQNERLCQLLGQGVEKRIPLPTVAAGVDETIQTGA